VTAVTDISAPTYRELLEMALELGRADGQFAASFESGATAEGPAPRCLGRTPEEFAGLLWGRAGTLPAGLEVNAPLWYATGFAEGLAATAPRRHGEVAGARIRRAFT
jgi:hypothetical protein